MRENEQDTLRFLVAAASRSGSMFLLHLMQAFLGAQMTPLAKVHSARNSVDDYSPDYRYFSDSFAFVRTHAITTLKIEDPGLDDDCATLAAASPSTKVLASFRPIEKIVNSHGNIKPWGMPADRVVSQWIAALEFYEAMQSQNRLWMLDLDAQDQFDSEAFATFLGCQLSATASTFAADWPRINDLATQKSTSEDATPIRSNYSKADLVAAFPAIPDAERRYRALL